MNKIISQFKISDKLAEKTIRKEIGKWERKGDNHWALKLFFYDLDKRRKEFDKEFAQVQLKKMKFKIQYQVSLPAGLMRHLEKKFPNLFKEKKEFEWFKKTFPEFVILKKV